MDFDLAPDDDVRRLEIRAWLRRHPRPSARQLAEAGYVVPHWPAPWGLDADPLHQLVVDEELARAGVARPVNPIGIGWAAPTILLAGTQAQKDRYLWPALAGEEIWCQLFSEPDAGSDLASLTTSAVRDGDEWVVNGSKIWTSGAHRARYGILIARTDPTAPRHRGISYFVCPMDLPGLTMTPIIDMTGVHSFNQVFFDDVRLPADALVGAAGDGWRLAKATLANERVSLSSGGALWGAGPSAADLLRLVRDSGGCADPSMRQQLARVWAEAEVLRLVRLRSLSARMAGRAPGPEASVQKLMADEHGQHVMEVAARLAGTDAMIAGSGPVGRLDGRAATAPTEIRTGRAGTGSVQGDRVEGDRVEGDRVEGDRVQGDRVEGDRAATARVEGADPVWYYGSLFAPALTIGGGTWAVQRNIVAERVLGLPHEPDVASATGAPARTG